MDATDSIFCEAADLLTLPPISLDPVGEQVHANTQVLQILNSTVLAIEEKISSLLSVSSVLPSSIAAGKGDLLQALSIIPPMRRLLPLTYLPFIVCLLLVPLSIMTPEN